MQYIYPLKLPQLSAATHFALYNYVLSTPSWYKRNIKQNCPEYIDQDYFRHSFHEKSNTENDMAEYSNWFITDDLIDMIRKDCTNNFYSFASYAKDENMDFYFQCIDKGSVAAPHRDLPRNMSFLYFLNGFDENGYTHFYEDLVKDPNRWLYDLNEIRGPIQTYQLKSRQWYVMRHDVVHSVSNIKKERVAIVARFSKDFHYETWVNEHFHLIDNSNDKFHYIQMASPTGFEPVLSP